MATHQTAEIGDWFITLDGQFLRVWGLGYDQGIVDKVVIQQLNSRTRILSVPEWQRMDLAPYPMMDDDQGNVSLL